MELYPATVLVGALVLLMVVLWAGFLVWGFRSGQFRGGEEMRRLPLDDDLPVSARTGGRHA